LIVDGAGNHKSGELAIPANVTLARLPAHSPELNPQENIWDETLGEALQKLHRQIYDEVCEMLVDGSLYVPELLKPWLVPSYIASSIWKLVLDPSTSSSRPQGFERLAAAR
jgi:transposase